MFFFSTLLCRNFRIGQKGYWYFSVIQDFSDNFIFIIGYGRCGSALYVMVRQTLDCLDVTRYRSMGVANVIR